MLHTGPAHHGQCALRGVYKWHEQIKKALSPSILICTSPFALAIEEVSPQMTSTQELRPNLMIIRLTNEIVRCIYHLCCHVVVPVAVAAEKG